MQFLSHNGFSVDQQVEDVIQYLLLEDNDIFQAFIKEFPEWRNVLWDGSYVNTEAMGVDSEWVSWIIDWIEDSAEIQWYEGEPVLYEADEPIDNFFDDKEW